MSKKIHVLKSNSPNKKERELYQGEGSSKAIMRTPNMLFRYGNKTSTKEKRQNDQYSRETEIIKSQKDFTQIIA